MSPFSRQQPVCQGHQVLFVQHLVSAIQANCRKSETSADDQRQAGQQVSLGMRLDELRTAMRHNHQATWRTTGLQLMSAVMVAEVDWVREGRSRADAVRRSLVKQLATAPATRRQEETAIRRLLQCRRSDRVVRPREPPRKPL